MTEYFLFEYSLERSIYVVFKQPALNVAGMKRYAFRRAETDFFREGKVSGKDESGIPAAFLFEKISYFLVGLSELLHFTHALTVFRVEYDLTAAGRYVCIPEITYFEVYKVVNAAGFRVFDSRVNSFFEDIRRDYTILRFFFGSGEGVFSEVLPVLLIIIFKMHKTVV